MTTPLDTATLVTRHCEYSGDCDYSRQSPRIDEWTDEGGDISSHDELVSDYLSGDYRWTVRR